MEKQKFLDLGSWEKKFFTSIPFIQITGKFIPSTSFVFYNQQKR